MILQVRRQPGPVHAVYSGRARVGYLVERSNGGWYWELTMTSEHFRGFPRGEADTEERALAALDQMFGVWAQAARLERR